MSDYPNRTSKTMSTTATITAYQSEAPGKKANDSNITPKKAMKLKKKRSPRVNATGRNPLRLKLGLLMSQKVIPVIDSASSTKKSAVGVVHCIHESTQTLPIAKPFAR